MSPQSIDVVYTWVNRDDPVWLKKYQIAAGKGEEPHYTRYANWGEITLSVKTIRKFAPFVRNIFIVTDNQIPPDIDLVLYNVKIVDHNDILGPEACRPTFKSNTIESYLHNIPELSENFLYFNDDTFLGSELKYKHLFNRKNIPHADLRVHRYTPKDYKNANWRRVLYNTQQLFMKKYKIDFPYSYTHQATMMNKTACRKTWKIFGKQLAKSAKHPFRFPYEDTLHFVLLSQMVGHKLGLMRIRTAHPYKMLNCKVCTKSSARSTFKALLKNAPTLFCLNNLNPTTAEQFKQFSLDFSMLLL